MFSQPKSTTFLRPLRAASQQQACLRSGYARRYLSQTASRRAPITTPPAHKPRSFKSSLARWAIAIGGVYLYATSDFFTPNGPYARQLVSLDSRIPTTDEENEQLPTVEEVNRQRRERQAKQREQYRQQERDRISASSQASSDPSTSTPPAPSSSLSSPSDSPPSSPQTISPDALEDEADQQGAFNEETGEINWDCPCLGGMAYGPCGEQFREAFSCFVYSQEEPKGIECVDRFKAMQDCFRLHPDVYGAELADEEPSEEELAAMRAEQAQDDAQTPAAASAGRAQAEAQKQ